MNDSKKISATFKKIEKVISRAQIENKKGNGAISDGTKQTYIDTLKSVLREASRRFGIEDIKKLKPFHTENIIKDKIKQGGSPQNIRKIVHSLNYFQQNCVKTRIFKEKQNVQITNHKKMLDIIKENNVIRRSTDSHRMRATQDDCFKVINEMKKHNEFLAQISYYQLLTGFRISEAIRQTSENINLNTNKHTSKKAKGGLTNIVHTQHHTPNERAFIQNLFINAEKGTGRIFNRKKDYEGNYISDEAIRRSVTRLAKRCADSLGIKGINNESFSSHSFRGAFAHARMLFYCKHNKNIDQIIQSKINEQPRLRKKYNNFESRIKNKCKYPSLRNIHLYEKIQWLVSTDLNHSRQDVTRFYLSSYEIKSELLKYKTK